MKIDDCTKQMINSRSLVQIESYGIRLKRGVGICPFHPDKDPSFTARMRNGKLQWKCQACGKKGHDIFSFVAEMEGLDITKDFPKVAEICAQRCGLAGLNVEGVINTMHQIAPIAPREQEPPHYLNAEVEKMEMGLERTNLYKFLCSVFLPSEVSRVMRLYRVGIGYYLDKYKNWEMGSSPCRLQGSMLCTAFPSIDTEGNTHAIKVIPYSAADGHRIKDADSRATLYTFKPEQNKGAYFGTHLLPLYSSYPIALVESEKTALIGTLFYPCYLWIAVGGASFFDPTSQEQRVKLDALRGHVIHIFPDADHMEDWRAKAGVLKTYGFDARLRDEVLSLFPSNCGVDIGDIILWEMERLRDPKNLKFE